LGTASTCARRTAFDMNNSQLSAAIGIFALLPWSILAQSLSDLGANAPTPGANDLSQLSVSGNKTAPDGLNYYTDNESGHSAGEPGQTFTTGNNSAGYVLNSLAVRTAGLGSSTYNNIGTAQPYYLHLYSVSGTSATLLQSYTSANVAFNDGDWLKWSGFAIGLAPNRSYAWSFGKASSIAGWEPMAVATNNPFAGGEIGLISPVTGAISRGSSHGFDAVFDLGMTPATAPIVGQVTLSPTNNVFAGTAVAFLASAIGAQPLHFQWQFNSGTGFNDISGANTNVLTFNAAVTNSGSYQLVVTNSYGATTSAPISLSVTLDTNVPLVLRGFNVGITNVELDFSKRLQPATATNIANYAFVDGLGITGAALAPDGATVLLATAPLAYGSNYTLIINGISDLANPPNFIAADTTVNFTASPRQRMSLDAGWRFKLGDPADVTTNVTWYPEIGNLAKLDAGAVGSATNTSSESYLETIRPDIFATHAGENVSYVQTNYDDTTWRLLNLPHDWAVELPFSSSADGGHGFKPVGNSGFGANNFGWYRRTFTLPSNFAGQTLWLEFDGVYRNCLVWLNGHLLGRNVSGYSSFNFDATPYANPGGTNVLVVRVDASRFEGWFYEGAGIYRHVWLTAADPVHVAEWGTFVATSSLVGSNATVTVQTEITNQSATATSTATVTSTILDAANHPVRTITTPLVVLANQGLVVTQTVAFPANLWSLQSPYLYKLVSTISNQNGVADIYHTPFGVRTVSIDSTNGVFINGQHVWIQGMCNHQDMAGVGAALPDRLQYYRIERLKQMGCNAYRSSHNAPTAELLDACDRLGMLVLDENRRIGTNAEPLGELTRQIRRDRNHPSVFMWSLANEEPLQGTSTGASIMQAMQNLVHSLDSTRRCTAALNSWGSGFSSVLDVNGFNYQLGQQDSFHTGNPGWPIIGSETASIVSDRGLYTNDTVNGYVWGYDIENSAVSWGETAEGWWSYYFARPWSSGGFAWTGFDYRGEPTPYGWPCINSHFGTLDMCGFPKDNFYYYQANWSYKPVLHMFPHWNWSTVGQPVNVWVFGNCQSVELFTNGSSLGRQPLNALGHVEWDNVPFSPGTLQAIGYNNGVPVITNSIATTGAPARLALIPDRTTILADGQDVSVVTVAVLDSQNRVVPTATNLITFSLTGGGAILGVGNGDPSSHEADQGHQRSAFNGLAQIIVQSAAQTTPITLTATAPGLASTNIVITPATTLPPPAVPQAVVAVGGNRQVTVTWDIVPGAATYNLWRSTTSGGPYNLVAPNIGGVNLGCVDTNVANLTTYYYVVTANGDWNNGASGYSAEVSATPAPVVAGLTATVTNGAITLRWQSVPGASYNLKRSYATGGPYTTIAASLVTTNFTDVNVLSCQPYFYVVTLTNSAYESLNSLETSAELPGSLPPQFTSADVGSVGLSGSASFCSGQYSISGSGADIWNNADAFQFVYTYVPISTNCDIRARISSVQNTHSNAKAAVMIRESLDAGSRSALVDVEPAAGIEFLFRTNTAGASSVVSVSGQSAPNWIRLTRTNNLFRAYWSPDGVSWNQIGVTNISMAGTGAYIGLAVCAHNNSALNTSVFDNVSASFLTNIPPVVSWITPANNQAIYQANVIPLTASASDPDGSISLVSFFNGQTLLGSASTGNSGQFTLPWSNAPAGNYSLSALATDNSGATNTIPKTIAVAVIPPPSIVLQLTNGSYAPFSFSSTVQTGQTYVIEASSNLMDWHPVSTNQPANGLLQFTDTNSASSALFYRIKIPPSP
jgi:beta-galactosidase